MSCECEAAAQVAAMLKRWAVVANLAAVEGSEADVLRSVFAVATLSAKEFVADAGVGGAQRLLRQEAAARSICDIVVALESGQAIEPGSALHQQARSAAIRLASYPELSTFSVDKAVVIS